MWYYAERNKKIGPVSFEQLKKIAVTGSVQGGTMVLRLGSKTWVVARSVPGLLSAAMTIPLTTDTCGAPMALPLTDAGVPLPSVKIAELLSDGAAPTSPSEGEKSWRPRGAKWQGISTLVNAGVIGSRALLFFFCAWLVLSGSISRKESGGSEKGPVSAEKPIEGTTVVFAEGIGGTAEEALKDAFRNAVRRVVGVFVNQETLVKDDEIISDKVLNYSDGVIKKYEEVSQTQEKGIFRTTIRAAVESRSVLAKLEAAHITVKQVDVKKIVDEEMNRLAKEITEQEGQKNAQALMQQAVQSLPRNILEARVVGNPEQGARDGDKIALNVNIEIAVTRKAYDVMAAKLERTLKIIAKRKGDFTMVGSHWRNIKGLIQVPKTLEFLPKGSNDKGGNLVIVNTHRSQDNSRTEWNWYHLEVPTSLDTYANRHCAIKLSLLGNDGQLVINDRFLFPDTIFCISPIYSYGPSKKHSWPFDRNGYAVSPFFFCGGPNSQRDYCIVRTMMRSIPLTLNEIKRVGNVQCELGYQE